ncbi:MAG: hypothetical protein COX30_00670 [Candidatus Moranbacteria bacterium CG23_combo_of_CG06-09_8_20_14_all_39_10]|nr:MAG: hypothetical protein COX30_00670 [Candidatus Moranbacteria bacterium CG23_combo_of_CG06-09_8_20_14_all_39_10]
MPSKIDFFDGVKRNPVPASSCRVTNSDSAQSRQEKSTQLRATNQLASLERDEKTFPNPATSGNSDGEWLQVKPFQQKPIFL